MPVHAERILADARSRYAKNVPEELTGS
jgi:hypothetical protein